jgi:hypothetical protein
MDTISGLLEQNDTGKTVTDDGKVVRTFKCREKISIPLELVARSVAPVERDGLSEDSDEKYGGRIVEGTASSTSVDSYGTEMSREGLLRMQTQMENGIPLLPRHNNGMGRPVEWDEVIGRTIKGDVERAEVVGAANSLEPQYVLRVTSMLYSDDSVADKLLNRLELGQPVGQSIGGWFLSVRVITNSEDEVERVIVDDVELDHLALTRAPANPDSNGLYTLRSRLQEVIKPEDRHVVDVSDNEDGTVTVVFEKHEDKDDDDEMSRANSELNKRDVVSFQNISLAPEGDKWDWSTKTQNEILGPDGDNWERYKEAHLWYDPENTEVKSGYKLPIARMYGNELKVVFSGVSSAMAALNGARGGVDIPDSERQKVYEHISKYYDKFDKQPPELQSTLENDVMSDDKDDVEIVNKDNGQDLVENSSNGVSEERTLDVSVQTVQDDQDTNSLSVNPTDALGSAVRSNPPTQNNNSGAEMSDDMISKFETMLNRSIGGLVERVQNLEARAIEPIAQEPVLEPTKAAETTVEPIERRLAAAEAALARLSEQPVRRGIATTNIRAGIGATTQIDTMINRARELETAPTLCAIMERHKETLAEEQGMNKMTISQLRDLLGAGLRAAVNDGLIGNSTAKWQ